MDAHVFVAVIHCLRTFLVSLNKNPGIKPFIYGKRVEKHTNNVCSAGFITKSSSIPQIGAFARIFLVTLVLNP